MSKDFDNDFQMEDGYSSANRPVNGQRPQGRPMQGARPQQGQGVRTANGQRPQGARHVQGGQRPQGARPANGQRPQGRPMEGRPMANGQRPQGRPMQGGQRPQGRPMEGRPMQGSRGGQMPMNQGMRNASRPSGGYNASGSNKSLPLIILIVEIVIFVGLIVGFFVLKNKISNGDASSKTEQAEGQSNGVNVDNDNFTLTCTKVQLANDANGNPAALIFFTFTNKTDTPLSMAEVFPASLKQSGMECSTDVTFAEEHPELANKDSQISAGQSLECCYAFGLSDLTSTITLTVHDNYESFVDIGSTDINLS